MEALEATSTERLRGRQASRAELFRERDSVWLYDPWCFTPWYTASLAEALIEAQSSVRLVCPRYHFEPEHFTQCGLVPRPGVLDITSRLRLRRPAFRQVLRSVEYGINTAALMGSLGRRRPKILHLQLCPLLARGIVADLWFLSWAKRCGVHAVHTVHNLLPHEGKHDSSPLHRRLYRLCDRLICHSDDIATRLGEEFGVEEERIDVIPHGPLFAEQPRMTVWEARLRLGLDSDRPLFLSQGILAPYKGADLLLEAWFDLQKMLPAGSPPPCLLFAGRGGEDEVRRLREGVLQLGLDASVRLDMRYIPAAELPYYYHAADVLVYPYREITTSGALMTGLNYQKPMIASDLPAFRAVIDDGVNGLLLHEISRTALAGAMLRLLTDSALQARIRAGAASNRARQVQWPEIAEWTLAVYGKALTSPALTASSRD